MERLKLIAHQWFKRHSLTKEVDEELMFHIEQRARSYENDGLSAAESLARAQERFGDFQRIREQCIQIAAQSSTGVFAMKILFTVTFVVGVLIRSLALEYRVTRIGHILMAIAVLGGLLLYGRRLGATREAPTEQPLRLELSDRSSTIPRSFDEQGRTPFDRVRVDER